MKEDILTAVIIDDEPEAVLNLENLLKAEASVRVAGTVTDSAKALAALLKHKPDVLFLDIQMPGITGFDVLRLIKEYELKSYIVFTTAYDQFAIKAIKAGAFDYLLKPIDPAELKDAIIKVKTDTASHSLEQRLESLEKAVQNHRKLRFNTRSGFILIHPDDIFYIEADANYSEIYLSKEKREVVSMNLGAVEDILPNQFIRISRSVILNSHYLTKVSGVNRRCVMKKEGEEMEFRIPEKQLAELRRVIGE
jgi:DNA-binding LytR/AlgR family response regulator